MRPISRQATLDEALEQGINEAIREMDDLPRDIAHELEDFNNEVECFWAEQEEGRTCWYWERDQMIDECYEREDVWDWDSEECLTRAVWNDREKNDCEWDGGEWIWEDTEQTWGWCRTYWDREAENCWNDGGDWIWEWDDGYEWGWCEWHGDDDWMILQKKRAEFASIKKHTTVRKMPFAWKRSLNKLIKKNKRTGEDEEEWHEDSSDGHFECWE